MRDVPASEGSQFHGTEHPVDTVELSGAELPDGRRSVPRFRVNGTCGGRGRAGTGPGLQGAHLRKHRSSTGGSEYSLAVVLDGARGTGPGRREDHGRGFEKVDSEGV